MTMGPRRRRHRDDDGSLPLTMMFVILAVGLALVMATVVAGQQRETRNGAQRVNAINAAQAGLDVALDNLRMAARADGSGDPRALPCSDMTGPVSAAGGATYKVRIWYTTTPPPSGDTAWAALAANRWTCGTTVTSVPAYALIESTGSAGVTRTLTATYGFASMTAVDKAGNGQVRAYNRTGKENCLSSGHGRPVIGNPLWVKKCDEEDPKQRFTYEAGLTIAMADLTAPGGERLCVDGGWPMSAGNPVTLEECATEPIPQQVWGSDDLSVFYAKPDAATTLCLRASVADIPGVAVNLAAPTMPNTCDDEWTSTGTFISDPRFGTGRAGPATRQLVNADQFSRCIDVTDERVPHDQIIVAPCQQSLAGAVRWDQNWILPDIQAGASRAEGRIYTKDGGTTYCLRGPDSTRPLENYVTVEACDIAAVAPANQRWIVNADTGQASTSHRIESSHLGDAVNPTHCMSPTDPTADDPDMWADANIELSKLVLVDCDGTDLQKWNASSFVEQVGLKDIVED